MVPRTGAPGTNGPLNLTPNQLPNSAESVSAAPTPVPSARAAGSSSRFNRCSSSCATSGLRMLATAAATCNQMVAGRRFAPPSSRSRGIARPDRLPNLVACDTSSLCSLSLRCSRVRAPCAPKRSLATRTRASRGARPSSGCRSLTPHLHGRYVGGVTFTVLDASPNQELDAALANVSAYSRILPFTKDARLLGGTRDDFLILAPTGHVVPGGVGEHRGRVRAGRSSSGASSTSS